MSEEFAEQDERLLGRDPSSVDEFKLSGLTPAPSEVVRAPRVQESHVNMECRLLQIVEVSARPIGRSLVLGEVVRFHVDDAVISDFRIDATSSPRSAE